MERKEEHDIARKLKILNHAKVHGDISKTCRYFVLCVTDLNIESSKGLKV
jgi:hypothetical protein